MAFFNKVNKAAISPAPPQVKAAAAGGYSRNEAGLGPEMIGQYYTSQEGQIRNR